jgi:hypothetical protein
MKDSAKRSRRSALAIVVATIFLAIGAVTVISKQMVKAREGSNNQEKRLPVTQAANRNYVTVKVAGQDVQVDSQTGQIRELTPEEAQRMAEALKQSLNRSTDDLVQEQQPDGSVTMELDGRFQSVTVAKVNEDGSLSQSCVDNPEAAGAFFGIDPQLIDSKSAANRTGKQQPRVRPGKN